MMLGSATRGRVRMPTLVEQMVPMVLQSSFVSAVK
jgi:hypothetical protein